MKNPTVLDLREKKTIQTRIKTSSKKQDKKIYKLVLC
jgi:hypothetical protein